ncbi:MAG: hypothetical protein KIS94_13365 [Chitinophagales bacterium]|nr:hypothetical protein [Chitinophagales bacterium]
MASANPSNAPISTVENPMLCKNNGIIGYNISLLMSFSTLTTDKIQILRVRYFKTDCEL